MDVPLVAVCFAGLTRWTLDAQRKSIRARFLDVLRAENEVHLFHVTSAADTLPDFGPPHFIHQEERSLDPERFSSASVAQKGMMRGPPRSVGAESAPVPQVQVKEIQVKQVDRSIAQIRASKEMNASGGMSAAPAPAKARPTPNKDGSLPTPRRNPPRAAKKAQ